MPPLNDSSLVGMRVRCETENVRPTRDEPVHMAFLPGNGRAGIELRRQIGGAIRTDMPDKSRLVSWASQFLADFTRNLFKPPAPNQGASSARRRSASRL
jgi:hypothetical protein